MADYEVIDQEQNVVETFQGCKDYQDATNKMVLAGLTPVDNYLLVESVMATRETAEKLYKESCELILNICRRDQEIKNAHGYIEDAKGKEAGALVQIGTIDSKEKVTLLAHARTERQISTWAAQKAIDRWKLENRAEAAALYEMLIGSVLEGRAWEVYTNKKTIYVAFKEDGIYYSTEENKDWVWIVCPFEF